MVALAGVGRQAIGLILILCTAIIWIVTSFISESLVSAGSGGTAKVPPFLLTWLATTLFTLYLPFLQVKQAIMDCWQHLTAKKEGQGTYAAVPVAEGQAVMTGFEAPAVRQVLSVTSLDKLMDKQTVVAAAWAMPLWFLAQYAFNQSLALTSVTSNTILSSTSSLFTFGLSLLLLGEKFTLRKLACILACILGTALVTLSDVRAEERLAVHAPPPPPLLESPAALGQAGQLQDQVAAVSHGLRKMDTWSQVPPGGSAYNGLPFSSRRTTLWALRAISSSAGSSPTKEAPHDPRQSLISTGITGVSAPPPGPAPPAHPGAKSPLLGDLLVLASGALYAAYTVVMRLKMPGEEAGQQVAQFFGYIGLFTTVGLAPIVVLLLLTGSIDLAKIPRDSYLIILLEGMLDYVLSDYLWARAVMLLGPTVATLSLSVQIPIAGVMDLIVGEIPDWTHFADTIAMSLVGTTCILVGFVGINLGSSSPEGQHGRERLTGHDRQAGKDREEEALLGHAGVVHGGEAVSNGSLQQRGSTPAHAGSSSVGRQAVSVAQQQAGLGSHTHTGRMPARPLKLKGSDVEEQ